MALEPTFNFQGNDNCLLSETLSCGASPDSLSDHGKSHFRPLLSASLGLAYTGFWCEPQLHWLHCTSILWIRPPVYQLGGTIVLVLGEAGNYSATQLYIQHLQIEDTLGSLFKNASIKEPFFRTLPLNKATKDGESCRIFTWIFAPLLLLVDTLWLCLHIIVNLRPGTVILECETHEMLAQRTMLLEEIEYLNWKVCSGQVTKLGSTSPGAFISSTPRAGRAEILETWDQVGVGK